MKRIILSVASLMLVASGAHAVPFDSSGLKVESGAAQARSDADGTALFEFLARFGLAKISGDARAPAADSRSKPPSRSVECEEAKKAEAKRAGTDKPGLQAAGPEPVYLAF